MSRSQRWAARWDFVLQDECQDENPVQREIASMLAEPHGNYMVVGDPAQAIYGFRGSDPTGMLTFAQRWTASVVHMHRNYRCGTDIATAANGSLAAMSPDTHLGMQITAERTVTGSVDARVFEDADCEAEGVAARIRELHADGVEYRDQVVLYRTNAQSRGVEEACIGARIPYVVLGGTNFYDRKEVKDLLGYLRIAAGRATFEDVRKCINAPFRYLGKAFIDRIEQVAIGRNRAGSSSARDGAKLEWTDIVRNVIDGTGIQGRQRTSAIDWCGLIDETSRRIAIANAMVETNPLAAEVLDARPAQVLEDILLATGYVKWLTRDEGTESPENNRVSNVRELVRAAGRFNTVTGLLDYIDETLEEARRAKAGEGTSANRVTLMSIHRSKGLEYRAVFLIGCNEAVLPHARCENLDEERRLFYVATTRAKDFLAYSAVNRAAVGPKVMELQASRFLTEAGLVPTYDGTVSTRVDTDQAVS